MGNGRVHFILFLDGLHFDVVGKLKGFRSSEAIRLAICCRLGSDGRVLELSEPIALPFPGRRRKGDCAPTGYLGLIRIGVGGPDFIRPAARGR